jgi:phosphate transport system protein
MPRATLDHQLSNLHDEILLLGSMVEQAMLSAVDALKRRDITTAQKILKNDTLINEKRFAIENAILIILATQQPIAHDLRLITANLEIITELERMGDYAKGIAKVIIRLGEDPISIPTRDFSRMCELSVSMLHRALTAFIQEDARTASMIPTEDSEVDALYNAVSRTIINQMVENPASIDHANLLMWVAHNLERMADRVTNICERTVFIATGELLEMDSADDEEEEDEEEGE